MFRTPTILKLERYSYVLNNSLRYVDQTGFEDEPVPVNKIEVEGMRPPRAFYLADGGARVWATGQSGMSGEGSGGAGNGNADAKPPQEPCPPPPGTSISLPRRQFDGFGASIPVGRYPLAVTIALDRYNRWYWGVAVGGGARQAGPFFLWRNSWQRGPAPNESELEGFMTGSAVTIVATPVGASFPLTVPWVRLR